MFKQLSELSLSGRAEKNRPARGSFEVVVIHTLQEDGSQICTPHIWFNVILLIGNYVTTVEKNTRVSTKSEYAKKYF